MVYIDVGGCGGGRLMSVILWGKGVKSYAIEAFCYIQTWVVVEMMLLSMAL